MTDLRLLRKFAHPRYLSGPMIEAPLRDVVVGEICDVRRHWREDAVVARAQVVGFRHEMAVLSLLGNADGLSPDSVLVPTGGALTIRIDDSVLGTVLDTSGRQIVRLVASHPSTRAARLCTLNSGAPSFQYRVPIQEIFHTGIRVMDAFLTCGVGQRMGIFAVAGAGKTSLIAMLMEHADADVFVVGLIGERGREVSEFVEAMKKSPHRERSVVVYSTSDASSMDRCNAALLATTVAEYFRDHGCRVVLIQDSLTRYARALRDVALAAGEAPVRRGYPASVFEALPRLLERPGAFVSGSITAFYTILLESEDEPDPMAEEIRSILDGHIFLSRKLAEKNQYPAIDVLRSLSRVAIQVCSSSQLMLAASIRGKLSRLEELQLMQDLGEYRPGENAGNDRLLREQSKLLEWLAQARGNKSDMAMVLHEMKKYAA